MSASQAKASQWSSGLQATAPSTLLVLPLWPLVSIKVRGFSPAPGFQAMSVSGPVLDVYDVRVPEELCVSSSATQPTEASWPVRLHATSGLMADITWGPRTGCQAPASQTATSAVGPQPISPGRGLFAPARYRLSA